MRGETLSAVELAAARPMRGEGGRVLRAFCPFHQSDTQRSLRVDAVSGRFFCFACGVWGFTETAREEWTAQKKQEAATSLPRGRVRLPPLPPPEPEFTSDTELLEDWMAAYREMLPGSTGEAYLQSRGIPLAVAQRCGLGYAGPGDWAHRDERGRPLRDWCGGRLVFPHTTPDGRLVNLYGRAVGADVPKAYRHDHLAGAKGYFLGAGLAGGSDLPLHVCEGPFDALSLRAAGVGRVVAIFGVHGWRWTWAREVKEIVFALDADPAGQTVWHALARAARLRGKRVGFLPPESYGGCKDVSEAWAAGRLTGVAIPS
ncbi:MAG: toprim domain-containing protein [Bryobacterales bacterium]|nr:toprim domain-containing protein [Bryobacterales bacterium]